MERARAFIRSFEIVRVAPVAHLDGVCVPLMGRLANDEMMVNRPHDPACCLRRRHGYVHASADATSSPSPSHSINAAHATRRAGGSVASRASETKTSQNEGHHAKDDADNSEQDAPFSMFFAFLRDQ